MLSSLWTVRPGIGTGDVGDAGAGGMGVVGVVGMGGRSVWPLRSDGAIAESSEVSRCLLVVLLAGSSSPMIDTLASLERELPASGSSAMSDTERSSSCTAASVRQPRLG